MRKLLFVLILAAVSFAAQAQYATVPAAKRVGCRIKLDDQKLTPAQSALLMSDIAGEDYSPDWCKARGWRAAGISMISGGAVLAVGGAVTAMVGLLTSALGAGIGAATGAIVGSIGGEEAAQEAGSQGAQQGAEAGVPITTAGLIIMGVGTGIHIAGVPITVVNSVKMSRLVDKYNESVLPNPELIPDEEPVPEVQLSLAGTRNGIGLCINF